MGWADKKTVEDVKDWKSFAEYCQQETGIPYPTQKQIGVLRGAINDWFDEYPHTSYATLCQIVKWAKERRKRYATPGNLLKGGFRYAWEDGYLPELDPDYDDRDADLEADIERALQQEKDPAWRRRLIVAQTNAARDEVYREWLTERGNCATIQR